MHGIPAATCRRTPTLPSCRASSKQLTLCVPWGRQDVWRRYVAFALSCLLPALFCCLFTRIHLALHDSWHVVSFSPGSVILSSTLIACSTIHEPCRQPPVGACYLLSYCLIPSLVQGAIIPGADVIPIQLQNGLTVGGNLLVLLGICVGSRIFAYLAIWVVVRFKHI